MGTALYCAEKPLNPDKILRESLANGKPIPQATVNQMMEEQKKSLARDAVSFKMLFGQSIPEKTIAQADSKIAEAARQHNQNLQQQLHAHQPK
jgi:hypothetical protein